MILLKQKKKSKHPIKFKINRFELNSKRFFHSITSAYLCKMSNIKLHDLHFQPFIKEEEIKGIIQSLVTQISRDCKGETPLFIGILNGSFMFVADFVKAYADACEVSFVKLASYQGTSSSEKVTQLVGLNEDLTGRTVVILEDIIDTGNTLQEIYRLFKDQNVKQLKIATLFFKPTVFKKELTIDYIGKSIPDKFIVGYGLDYNGLGRNYPAVYQLITTQQ